LNNILPAGALVRLEANPSAGPGRIIRVDGPARARVRFVWSKENLALDLNVDQLRRFTLPSGSRVISKRHDSAIGRITGLAVDERQGLRAYDVAINGCVEVLSEALVEPLPPDPTKPLELLEALDWSKVTDFALRWRMRQRIGLWYEESEGLPSLVGARIRPIAHQIYAARRVLFESLPRFVLADEVGLGKTIEAGLVLQALLAERPDLTVLVIAPGSMSRQWQTELYLRFGARVYRHIDRAEWPRLKATQREKIFTEEQRLIISTTLLQNVPRSAKPSSVRAEWCRNRRTCRPARVGTMSVRKYVLCRPQVRVEGLGTE
jgi:ATP-dependent helicase HepA